jgi:NHL repeat
MNAPEQKKRHLHRRSALLALAACLVALGLLAQASAATAATAAPTFCPPGSGAGQCSSPRGVATDFETGHLYVADRGNRRVDVFDADRNFLFAFGWGVDTGASELQTCTTASGCQAGLEGSGAGQFAKSIRIAVDNSPGSASRHDVYVGSDNFRVQKFDPTGTFLLAFGWGVDTGASEPQSCTTASGCQAGLAGAGECQLSSSEDPLAVGPGGNVFLVDNSGSEPNFTDRVEKFSPEGVCQKETVLLKGNFVLRQLAVDSSEDAYVAMDRPPVGMRKYALATPETKLCDLDPGIETNAIGFDAAGHVFASQREGLAGGIGLFQVITEYDSSCGLLSRFGYGQIEENLRGLAAFSNAEGDLFAGGWTDDETQSAGQIKQLKLPAPGPIVAPPSLKANPIGNTKATIAAEINPEGKASSYHVEYLSQEEFEDNGDSFATAKSSAVSALDFSAGKEFRLRAAQAQIGCPIASEQAIAEGKCLLPETEYRYRIVATNADNPTGTGDATVESTFTTRAPIEVDDLYAAEAGTTEITLRALVNPLGIPASGHFEYVTQAQFQASGFAAAKRIPDSEAGEGEIDFGSAETPVARAVTIYPLTPDTEYRYRLVLANPLIPQPIASEAKSFSTFRASQLTTGQCPANEAFRSGASASLPDCRAYELVSPLDKENGDIKVVTQLTTELPAVLNQSALSGDRFAYGSYRSFGDSPSASYTSQYIAARGPDGWSSHGISPPDGPQVKGGIEADYEIKVLSEDLCEAWPIPFGELTLAEGAIPGVKGLYRRSDRLCGAESYEALSAAAPEHAKGGTFGLEVQGISADGSLTVFAANDSLEGTGAPSNTTGKTQLYGKAPGEPPRFLCILPGGQTSKDPCSAGVSPGLQLFGKGEQADLTGALSADGGRVYWTAAKVGSPYQDGPIYLRENPFGEGAECAEASSPCTIAVSKDAEALSGTSASHFWAAASDGSRALFTTVGTGSGTGTGELYEFDLAGKATQRIAGAVKGVLGQSKDAERTYFVSGEAIPGAGKDATGKEAEAGKANLYFHEAGAGSGIYRFLGATPAADVNTVPIQGLTSAAALEPGARNSRVSPDGSHAAFMSSAPLTGYDNTDAKSGKADLEIFLYDAGADGGAGQLRCVSCNPSGARPVGEDIGRENKPLWAAARIAGFHTSLYSGRQLSDDGRRLFFDSQDPLTPRDTNGRLDVYEWEQVGTGSCDQTDVGFSSASGGCVELISSGKSDRDSEFLDASPDGRDVFFTTLASLLPQDYGLVDVYDARAGGGFPPPPAPPAGCEGEACQGPYTPPNDPTPASSSFRGAGNVVQGPASCRKGKVRRKGRCTARKQHKRANGHRRAAR